MVASSEYTLSRSSLIIEVAKYTLYPRSNITPLSSITNMVVGGVLAGFDTDAIAHEAGTPSADEDYAFYTPQTQKLLKIIESVKSALIYEIELDVIPSCDRFYLSGVPNPTTQNASSFTTQKFKLTTTQPVTAELFLETTNIPAGFGSAITIAKYSTETDYFTNGGTTKINPGVFKTELVVEKNSGDDYPVFYTEIAEVDIDGDDLGTPVVIASSTETFTTHVKSNGTYYHYLTVPEYTISSSLNRFQLRILAYSSANTTTLKYKIKGTSLSNVYSTLSTPYVNPLRGPAGPAGISGVSGGLVLYMDTPTVSQAVGSITATNPTNQTILDDPDTGSSTTITTTGITTTPVNFATFMTASSLLEETVIPAGLWSFNLHGNSDGSSMKYYIVVKEYQSDGTTLVDTLATGSTDSATVVSSQNIYVYQLYVNSYTLASLTSRIAIELWAFTDSGINQLVTQHRNNTLSNVVTTIAQFEGPVGPTGPVGPQGIQGITGDTGPTGATGAPGVVTGNTCYGEIYQTSDGTISLTTSYIGWNTGVAGNSLTTGFTAGTGSIPDSVDIQVAGVYQIVASFSIQSNTANRDARFGISVDGIVDSSTETDRHFQSSGSSGSFTITRLLDLTIGQKIGIQMKTIAESAVITPKNIQFNVTKLVGYGETGPAGATGADGSSGIETVDGDLGSSQTITGGSTVNFAGGSGSGLNLKTTASAYPLITSATTNRVTFESNSITKDAYVDVGNNYVCQVLYAAASPGYCHVEFKKPNSTLYFAGLIQSTESPLASDSYQFPDMYSIGRSGSRYRVVYEGSFNNTTLVADEDNDVLSVTYDGSAGTITFKVNGSDIGFQKTGLASNLVFHAKFEQYLHTTDSSTELAFTDILVRETSTSANTLTTVVDSGTLQQSHGGTGIDLENGGDGKLIIAASSGAASLQNLTAGNNIAIANGANSISIASTAASVSSTSGLYPVYWNTSTNAFVYYIAPAGK